MYALKIDGNPVFYANGVLVHNCDTVSQAMARYRDGGFVRLPSDYEEPDNMYRSVRKAYY